MLYLHVVSYTMYFTIHNVSYEKYKHISTLCAIKCADIYPRCLQNIFPEPSDHHSRQYPTTHTKFTRSRETYFPRNTLLYSVPGDVYRKCLAHIVDIRLHTLFLWLKNCLHANASLGNESTTVN